MFLTCNILHCKGRHDRNTSGRIVRLGTRSSRRIEREGGEGHNNLSFRYDIESPFQYDSHQSRYQYYI